MNTELLLNLYRVFSPSGNEKKMRKFIKRYVKTLGGVDIAEKNGNLYLTKGNAETYPCVCAHMDQVQRFHSKDFTPVIVDGIVLGFSPKTKQQQGLGADDKNGIWVALECLRKYDVLKVAFFWGEEIGCQGSSEADMDFFENCRFLVQCDRRNGFDLIYDVCGQMASEDFLADCGYEDFGYHLECGLSTDVATLAENGVGLSCVNISCGYYDPHTDHETTDLNELGNCLDFVCHIIENCTKVYPHTMQTRARFCSYPGSYYPSWFTKGYESNEDDKCMDEQEYFSSGCFDDDVDLIYHTLFWDEGYTFEDFYRDYAIDIFAPTKELAEQAYNAAKEELDERLDHHTA